MCCRPAVIRQSLWWRWLQNWHGAKKNSSTSLLAKTRKLTTTNLRVLGRQEVWSIYILLLYLLNSEYAKASKLNKAEKAVIVWMIITFSSFMFVHCFLIMKTIFHTQNLVLHGLNRLNFKFLQIFLDVRNLKFLRGNNISNLFFVKWKTYHIWKGMGVKTEYFFKWNFRELKQS